MTKTFDWADLAFADKKPVKDLKAIFIAAPRELSAKRFTELVKTYLPKGNLVLGLAKEEYIEGFENQPQFRTLRAATVQKIIDKTNASASPHKIYLLHYFQRETPIILEKLRFKHAVFVNGSWQYAFHHTPTYYTLVNSKTPYELVSPFTDEQEAKRYAEEIMDEMLQQAIFPREPEKSQEELMAIADQAAKLSFDYNFQTGAVLARRIPNTQTYRFLGLACNHVVPYWTYAMHVGASREKHFSPPHDLNHYDTVHAEVDIALVGGLQSLKDTTLFINLAPCPTCARMLCRTGVQEIVYRLDHSDGYAVQLLEKAGKTVRRMV